MIRSLLRTLPVVALATMLAAVPAAATGGHDNDDRRADAQQQRADDGDGETAHPSGKSRHEEPGNSGTQGKSPSDPDGDTNGGEDKPGGQGGYDDDKDGNNGCGNDNDFEDDNNGNCGGPDKPSQDVLSKESKSEQSKSEQSRVKQSEIRSEKSWQQTRTEHERTDRSEVRKYSVSGNLHCVGHAENTKWEGSSGSHTIDGVTISWDGDQLEITNDNDTEALVVWCAKGGNGFAGDSMTTGVDIDVVAAGDTVFRTFATDVSYVVFYDVDSDEDVAAGEQNQDDEFEDEDSSTEVDVTKLIEILKELDLDVTVRELLEHRTAVLIELLSLLGDEDTLVDDSDETRTDTENTDTTVDGSDTGTTADDTAVLSGELTAAPDADDTGVAAAAADTDDTDVAAAAAAADDDEISGSDALALTGGSIAFLAILALLTLGGGSLLVRRNERH